MRFKLLILLFGLGTFSSLVSATTSTNLKVDNQYVGIETIFNYQAFKTGYGNKLFATHPQSYSAFFGFNFSKYLGAEFGYETQPTKTNDAVLFAGDQLPNQPPLTGTEFDAVHSYYDASHPYLGVFAEYSSNYNVGAGKAKFQALIGVSSSKVKANNTRTANDAGLIVPQLVNTYSKRRTVLMVKLIAVADITSNLGLRLSLNYRNMGSFEITSLQPRAIPYVIKLKDAFGVGIGLKYVFKPR